MRSCDMGPQRVVYKGNSMEFPWGKFLLCFRAAVSVAEGKFRLVGWLCSLHPDDCCTCPRAGNPILKRKWPTYYIYIYIFDCLKIMVPLMLVISWSTSILLRPVWQSLRYCDFNHQSNPVAQNDGSTNPPLLFDVDLAIPPNSGIKSEHTIFDHIDILTINFWHL